MPRFDATNSECRVFARRAGMLARVGHDLEILVHDFWIEIDGDSLGITAELRAGTLHVVEAVEGRERRPGKLSAADKRQIDQNIAQDVLQAHRYPTIRFRSTRVEKEGGGYRIAGTLELHGATRAIDLFAERREDGRWHVETALSQPDFGIAPFKAFAGALRIKPEVTVEVSVPFRP